MHPRKLWLAVSLLTAFTVQAAVVYKWVDADGVVHYSDQASPGAEKIYTSAPNIASSTARATGSGAGNCAPPKPATGGLNYTRFFHYRAGQRSNILRRRCRRRAFEPCAWRCGPTTR